MPSNTKYTNHHIVVFLLTFFSYALFHATRKTFSNVKSTISDEWTPSFHNDTVNYTKPDQKPFPNQKGGGSVFGFNLRKVLSFGMCSTGIVYVYVAVWILNGLLQSTGWPAVVAVMGNWFGRSSRGFVLGLWSACASVGNIIGAFMVSSVLDYGYQYAFLFTSSAVFAGGIINFFGLVPTPKEIGLPEPDDEQTFVPDATVRINEAEPLLENQDTDTMDKASEDDNDDETHIVRKNSLERPKAIGFIQALLLPGVILWAETVADEISVWYDVGGIIGGVANLVSAAISADLGRQGPVQGNSEALSTVTGIVDGTGSVGAAIGQILVPVLQTNLGWQSVFILFMIMTAVTALCILPMFIREMIDLCAQRRRLWREKINEDNHAEENIFS
ncbi:hypothetical protein KUTeg_021325 [Tegillarca granosa]|uniref:Sugar phosphate exchanger 3 n=1 Tax=Tegillarca granosa TaxID=220873 RepID=A0ABQ9EGF4_TEGGR|nr:hypothetical protein KUTeg_021325 [Tegillarca granosa]